MIDVGSRHSLEDAKRHALEDAHQSINAGGLSRRLWAKREKYVWVGDIGIHEDDVIIALHIEGLLTTLETTPLHIAQITETGLMTIDAGGTS